MANYNPHAFNQFVLENDVVGFFSTPIILRSGRKSNWYVNWRRVADDVFLTDQLARMVMAFSVQHGLNPDTFYGVPAGATKLAVLTQYLWAKGDANYGKGSHALSIGREKPKEHGDPNDRFFVGVPRGRVVFIEDVTTTGGSLLKEIDKCLEARVQLMGEKGVPYFAMSNALELLPLAYTRLQPGPEVGRAIEKEFEEVGVQPVKLVNP